MEKKIYFDESNFSRIKSDANTVERLINTAVSEYNQLSLHAVQSDELEALFKSPEYFILDKLTGGQPLKIGGATVSKQKALEIIDKPAGFEQVVKQIKEISNGMNLRNFPSVVRDLTNYHLDASGNAIWIAIEAAREHCTYYAKTETQLSVASALEKVIESTNELKAALGGDLFDPEDIFTKMVLFTGRTTVRKNRYDKILINPQFITALK